MSVQISSQYDKSSVRHMHLNQTRQKDNLMRIHPWSSHVTILTHWGRVTHICVSKLTIIGSDNGLSPGRRQAIIWTNAGILLIWTLGTNFSEILGEIHIFPFKKMRLQMSSGKWGPYCLTLNVLTHYGPVAPYGMWFQWSLLYWCRWWLNTYSVPSHYLNKCWLIINEVLWYSTEVSFTRNVQDIYPWCEFEKLLILCYSHIFQGQMGKLIGPWEIWMKF